MSQVVSGTLVAGTTGVAINIVIGFIPDYIELFELTSAAEVVYRHYRCLEEAETTGQYGIEDTGAGVVNMCASAAAGFAAYDGSKLPSVLIESPIVGIGDVKVDVVDWTSTVATDALARTVTDIGTVIRPTTHNGYVYECTVAGTSSATEPTWPTVPGDTVLDNDVRFICREENIDGSPGLGFTIGGTLAVNSDLWAFKAERHDRMGDLGDAAEGDPITFP